MVVKNALILYMRLRELQAFQMSRVLTSQEYDESDSIFKKLGIQDCTDGQKLDDEVAKIIEQALQ